MKARLALLILLIPATVSARPIRTARRSLPVRLAQNIVHNANEAVQDCVRNWRMRFECAAVLGSAAYDFKTTRDNLNLPNAQEDNLLFGRRPSTARLALEGGTITFLQIDAMSYVHRNSKPTHPWELIYSVPITSLHVWAAQHNERLAEHLQ